MIPLTFPRDCISDSFRGISPVFKCSRKAPCLSASVTRIEARTRPWAALHGLKGHLQARFQGTQIHLAHSPFAFSTLRRSYLVLGECVGPLSTRSQQRSCWGQG